MMKYINKIHHFALLLLMALMSCSAEKSNPMAPPKLPSGGGGDQTTLAAETFTITLGGVSAKVISDELMGFNIVYCDNPDSYWSSGVLQNAIKASNPGFLRYPGGTVTTFFHWKNPSGNGWIDRWDTSNSMADKPTSAFMNIDEYIKVVGQSGAKPMLGINMDSGFAYDRKEEGLQEALDLMDYCKQKNFEVTYWYLGNEPYQADCNGGAKTPEQYAKMINYFAPSMKAINPNIKIVANWKSSISRRLADYQTLLSIAGANIDVIDTHCYWAWGTASWDAWLAKTPMVQFTQESLMTDIENFKKMVADNGYPNIKSAILEWNVGPNDDNSKNTGAAQSAMCESEMMMQFMLAGLDIATFWPLFWDSSWGERGYFSKKESKLNPISSIFNVLGQYQGDKLVDVVMSSKPHVMALVAKDANGEINICILNKNATKEIVNISGLDIHTKSITQSNQFVISSDLKSLDNVATLFEKKTSGLKLELNPISLTLITIK